jgi:uncharacterized protein YodC (DUF2158 family)
MSVLTTRSLGFAFVLAIAATSFGPAYSSPVSTTPSSSHQAPSAFQSGDLVRLRSGGPLMTVDSVKGNQADCFWTDENGVPNDATFPVDVLRRF